MADVAPTDGQPNTPQPADGAVKATPVVETTLTSPEVKTEVKADTTVDTTKVDATKVDAKTDPKADAKVEAKTEDATAFALKLPEDLKLDEAAVTSFKELAKAQKMTPETAQALIDFQANLGREALKAWDKQQNAVFAEWRADSVKQFREADFDAAKAALGLAADPDINKFLVETHLGDHPMMVRLLSRLGSLLAEDTFEQGGRPVKGKVDPASVLFPNSGPKAN
jgi:hypothetical protein